MRAILITAAFILAALWPVTVYSQAHYRYDGQYALPDATVTPGRINPSLVAYTDGRRVLVNGVEADLCAKDFRTGPWRNVSEATKR